MKKCIYSDIDNTLKALNALLKSDPSLNDIKKLLFKPILSAMTDLDIISQELQVQDPLSAHSNLTIHLDEIIFIITDNNRIKLTTKIEEQLTLIAHRISELNQSLLHFKDSQSTSPTPAIK
jgi:hypothetical protein